eukprot:2480958-Alexandrium_andersonii.AAC.1
MHGGVLRHVSCTGAALQPTARASLARPASTWRSDSSTPPVQLLAGSIPSGLHSVYLRDDSDRTPYRHSE